jgi:hypothetical protein
MEIKALVRQIQIMFVGFFMAQVAFLGIVSFVNATKPPEANRLLEQLPFITALILLPLGYWFFQKQMFNFVQINDLHEKIATYRPAILVKWACFEGATLFAIVAFFLTGNLQLQYLAVGLVIHFAGHFPTHTRVCRELQVSEL